MTLIIRDLGQQAYEPIWRAMQRFTDLRSAHTPDEIWLLQHEPVYTQGMAGKAEHLLQTNQIPVVPVDRGGQITYHGPGQLVIYFLLDVTRRSKSPRQLVRLIEQYLVELLMHWHIMAAPKAEAPGIYIDQAKIASIGLRVRKGGCYHGAALNVAMNLSPFLDINPCGHVGLHMVQLTDFKPLISLDEVLSVAKPLLKKYFHVS